jgi:uncharacterized protein (TIRG00374 family)
VKGTLVKVLKLALVVGLMAFVFWNVSWHDRLELRGKDQKPVVEVGDILGPWKEASIRFKPEHGAERVVQPGRQADGRTLAVQPGFWTYWKNLDRWLFCIGAICYFLTTFIAGARWWWLLKVNGMDVALPEALRLTWIGIFFNTVVPGQTGGDLIKAIYIMRRCPGHRVAALVSVIVDRVLGLGSLAILAAVVVLFSLERFGMLAAAIWGVMLFVLLLGTVAFSRRLRTAVRLNSLIDRLPAKLSHLLKLVDQAVFFYRGHKRVITMSLLAGVLNHIVSVLSVVLIGDALGVGLPWMEYFVLIPVINIVSALPIGPNGWGVGEALYQNLFAKYGAVYLSGESAAQTMGTRGVALSVLYRLHLTFWSLLGGLFVLFDKNRVTADEVKKQVELEQKEEDQLPH